MWLSPCHRWMTMLNASRTATACQARRFLRRSPCDSISSSSPVITTAVPATAGSVPGTTVACIRRSLSCHAGTMTEMMSISPMTMQNSPAAVGTMLRWFRRVLRCGGPGTSGPAGCSSVRKPPPGVRAGRRTPTSGGSCLLISSFRQAPEHGFSAYWPRTARADNRPLIQACVMISHQRAIVRSAYLREIANSAPGLRSAPAEQQAHGFGPGAVRIAEDAAHGRGDRLGSRFAHPPHRHAQVLGLDHHDDAARLEGAHQRIGDLAGHALLHLRTPGVYVDEPGQLGKAGDLTLFVRDISDMGGADEWDQMVLAGAVNLDIAHQHHLVVISVEYGAEDFLRMLPHSGKLFGIGAGDPAGSAAEPVAVGILADRDEDLAHRTLDTVEIHALGAVRRDGGQTAGGN